ncbi:hypothetical protein CISG_05833 [Coccidioides immitis RMSCC 3703]|uniref:Uncharacterized protein n=2 Tax=Coccidioides immitis TaxID=5501 RepID=A0A0J8QXD4_COCIT|nr:hypothetical protein CIRG_10244 [Coccidioides immitis RMSCC 2394]KMU76690.1 hypothetical protein CISG_05833 [Coccidioides immitis RMSCC 3703]
MPPTRGQSPAANTRFRWNIRPADIPASHFPFSRIACADVPVCEADDDESYSLANSAGSSPKHGLVVETPAISRLTGCRDPEPRPYPGFKHPVEDCSTLFLWLLHGIRE